MIPDHYQTLLDLIDSTAFKNTAAKVSPEWWDLSKKELQTKLSPSKTATDLQVALWSKVQKSIETGQKVKLSEVCELARSSRTRAYQLFKDRPEIVVWLLVPLVDLKTDLAPLLSGVTSKLREIIDLPIRNSDGSTNATNIKILLRAAEILMDKTSIS